MIQMAGSGLNNQELLLPFVEHIGYKPANLGNKKNVGSVNGTKSGVSTNETGKYMDESKKVEDGVGVLDAVAIKSSDISIRDLGGIEAWEVLLRLRKQMQSLPRVWMYLLGAWEVLSRLWK